MNLLTVQTTRGNRPVMRFVPQLAFVLFSTWATVGVPIQAQTYTYDNQAQLLGAAVVSPESTRLILTKALAYCTGQFPRVKGESDTAYTKWVERHRFYLNASAGYREAAKQMATDPTLSEQQRAGFKKLIEVDFPRLVASQTEAVIEPLRIATENSAGEQMCGDYIGALNSGKFDLKVKDPQLTDFYDKNAPRR